MGRLDATDAQVRLEAENCRAELCGSMVDRRVGPLRRNQGPPLQEMESEWD
jgi:hypothetical protein